METRNTKLILLILLVSLAAVLWNGPGKQYLAKDESVHIQKDKNKTHVAVKPKRKSKLQLQPNLPFMNTPVVYEYQPGIHGEWPVSQWQNIKSNNYKALLGQGQYDVLIVPFETGGSGPTIDAIGRALLTRIFSQDYVDKTGYRVPDVGIVETVLGEGRRKYNSDNIFKLAGELGVKKIITGTIGAGSTNGILLKIDVYSNDGPPDQKKSPVLTKTIEDPANIRENISYAGIYPLLENLANELSEKKTDGSHSNKFTDTKITKPEIPAGKEAIFNNKDYMLAAYHLQFMALLAPASVPLYQERLFIKSIALINKLDKSSDDYKLLMARALFYLKRRPAALVVLGKPATPEGKALLSFLDGNVFEIKEEIGSIDSPLKKLIAQIELVNLMGSYHMTDEIKESAENIRLPNASWLYFLAIKMGEKDIWAHPDNTGLKQVLDTDYPFDDLKLETLIKTKFIKGEMPDTLDTAIWTLKHINKIMTGNIKGASENSLLPNVLDYLYLYSAVFEHNLIKEIQFRLYTQGSPDSAEEFIDGLNHFMPDHPEITALQSIIYNVLAKTASETEKDTLIINAYDAATKSMIWMGGQTPRSYDALMVINSILYYGNYGIIKKYKVIPVVPPSSIKTHRQLFNDNYFINAYMNFYTQDIPTRYYWGLEHDNGDYIRFYSIDYSNDNPEYLVKDLSALQEGFDNSRGVKNGKDTPDTYLEKYSNRFLGNPYRDSYLADFYEKKGDKEKVFEIYKDAINAGSKEWIYHYKLAFEYIERGQKQNAIETLRKYHFSNNGSDNVLNSNNASQMGRLLDYAELFDEAKKYYAISVATGSGSQDYIYAEKRLAELDNNYQNAARYALQMAKRYNDAQGYIDYFVYLHLFGQSNEAWNLFNDLLVTFKDKRPLLEAALIGNKIQKKDFDETRDWLIKLRNQNLLAPFELAHYAKNYYLVDRKPVNDISSTLREILNSHDTETDQLMFYTDIYNHLALGNHEETYHLFMHNKFKDISWCHNQTIYPYVVWSAIKAGKLDELLPMLDEGALKDKKACVENLQPFEMHLVDALLLYHKQKDDEAVESLKQANASIPEEPIWFIDNSYRLAEFLEWLYADTHNEKYKDLLLEIVNKQEGPMSLTSWAYAFEAKYTDDPERRMQALAYALYLDPLSSRISGFSEVEKRKAEKWWSKNDKYLQPPKNRNEVKTAA